MLSVKLFFSVSAQISAVHFLSLPQDRSCVLRVIDLYVNTRKMDSKGRRGEAFEAGFHDSWSAREAHGSHVARNQQAGLWPLGRYYHGRPGRTPSCKPRKPRERF